MGRLKVEGLDARTRGEAAGAAEAGDSAYDRGIVKGYFAFWNNQVMEAYLNRMNHKVLHASKRQESRSMTIKSGVRVSQDLIRL